MTNSAREQRRRHAATAGFGGLTLTMLVMIPAIAVGQQAAPPPQPTAIEGSTPHIYKTVNGVELRLHVFSASSMASSKPTPAVVFFFGGGWTAGTVQQFVPQAKHFVSRGMIAVVADYRVFGRHQTSPFEAIADAKSAIRWVRAHASELGVDPTHIAASGGSAGGHVALAAAVLDAFDQPGEDTKVSSKPSALVLFNPAVDTSHETPEVMKQRFLGKGRAASPFHHLRGDLPPILILHGRADVTIPFADVERFCSESRQLGNRCEVIGYEGATHGFFNYGRNDKWYNETLQEMDAFLTKLGYLPARPSSPRDLPL